MFFSRLKDMKNYNLNLLTTLTFIMLIFSSCEQDANFVVPEGESKLFAFSEIHKDDKIKVSVSTSIGVNTDDDFFFPKQSDAKVVLFENGVEMDNPGFRYISSEKAFVSQGSFRPEPGVEYSLSVTLKDDYKIKPIFASTIIPFQDSIKELKNVDIQEVIINGSQKMVSIDAGIDLNSFQNDYFILHPKTINGKENLFIREISSGNKSAYFSSLNNGLLLSAKNGASYVEISLETEESINRDEKVESIEFELQTITKDAFEYYKAVSKQMRAQSSPIAEPVIMYSNFESGLGLFTGFSKNVSSISIN
jgi:hypothetical protein